MKEPRWLTMEMVRAIHEESLALFGGAAGVRDEALLESAMAHPRSLFAYGDKPTIHHLAAAYCSGIIRNHPFVDGNKRAGLLAARAFLFLNGYDFDPNEAEEVNVIVELAAGTLGEGVLAEWFKSNTTRIVGK
ncbi:MAG: type II toxin-antitoxin system death-on-curing family toxin [Proteobacteria bacterium]|nr:type II toxin-antitoxin system death-on-curing family toxin [Pseudomonadota bacterium]